MFVNMPVNGVDRIEKKMSHITVVIDQVEGITPVKQSGTKPKPRPTFAAPKRKAGGAKAKAEEATSVTASEAPEEAGSVSEAVSETTPQADGAGDTTEGKE